MSAFSRGVQHQGVTSHSSSDTVPLDVLDRWVAGVPTEDDRALLAAYLEAHPDARGFLGLVGGADTVVPPTLDAMRTRVLHVANEATDTTTVRAGHVSSLTSPSTAGARSWRGRLSAVLGALALMLAVVAGWYGTRRSTLALVPARTYATQSGQRATIELADGGRITLAPRTTLTLVNDVAGHPRSATLVGEAHFDIVSNRAAVFAVRTGAVVTRVLGTTFDIRRYTDDSIGQIVVLSGKVSVQGMGTDVPRVVTAQMVAHFSDSSVTTAVVSDPTQYTDWTHGSLVFRDTPVPVVLATLKRWYGYEFRLSDTTLTTEFVTTVFPLGETQEMMQRLRRLLGVTMTFEDSVITLRPSPGVSVSAPRTRDKTIQPMTTTEVGR